MTPAPNVKKPAATTDVSPSTHRMVIMVCNVLSIKAIASAEATPGGVVSPSTT